MSMIQEKFDEWILYIGAENNLYGNNKVNAREVTIEPASVLPRGILGMTLQYQMRIKADGHEMCVSGKTNYLEDYKFVIQKQAWWIYASRFKIEIDIQIINIPGRDSDGCYVEKLSRDLWSQYGFC